MSQPNVIAPRVRAVENMVARAAAVTKSTRGNSSACLNCHVKLWLSFFFDGTGNHLAMHFPAKHSNVVSLFHAHEDDAAVGVRRFYYEGVGMPFEFKDRVETRTGHTRGGSYQYDVKGHKEEESSWNKAFGTEIDKRLEKAMFEFDLSVKDALRIRRVDEINVAAFGFSRGATTARAFVHWLASHSKVKVAGNTLTYDGIALNFKFLGLFDTVESVGDAGDNEQPELIKTSIPSYVQKCCHIVAAHEMRKAFPLTLVATERFREVVYPGAHADVGGGYADREQYRSNLLPRVGLQQMLDEARGAGLKMQSIGEMRAAPEWQALYKPSFGPPDSLFAAFRAYMAQVKKPSGPLDQVLASHNELYRAWIDSGRAIGDTRENLGQARQANDATRRDEALVQQHLLTNLARTPQGRGATAGLKTPAPAVHPDAEHFFENYVHDSFQHFSLSGGTMQSDLSTANYYELREIRRPKA
jgi:uncharacterized protein (DUF2235 family)